MQFPQPEIIKNQLSDNISIHTFTCPEDYLSVSTHIIESPTKLIVVDGQLVTYYAQKFREYTDSLNKPIERVFLSHDHPDHFFGVSAAFYDKDIYSLPETIFSLEQSGEHIRSALKPIFGDGVPDKIVIPSFTIKTGSETIDGITYEYEHIKDAEVEHQLVIKIPDYNVAILQDLMYSGGHLYIEEFSLDNWTDYLKELIDSEYILFFPGHGIPAGKKELQANIEYLDTVVDLANKHKNDVDAYKSEVLKAYPNRLAPQIMDIYIPRLFGN
jgi:glyoxylase-like metal-dependent hydrolase (beta-lactamase superfamily II)